VTTSRRGSFNWQNTWLKIIWPLALAITVDLSLFTTVLRTGIIHWVSSCAVGKILGFTTIFIKYAFILEIRTLDVAPETQI
jgi:ABC-type transport system involved in cytochrome bd biosynthesis fused ATPase/permease subunit